MIYPFRCRCGKNIDEWRAAADCAKPAFCPECGNQMIRIFTPTPANFPKTGYYNHGLGVYIRSSGDVKDAMKRIKDTTGESVVEVGSESANVRTHESNWDFTDKEKREMGSILQSVEG